MILQKFGALQYGEFRIPNMLSNLGLTYDLIKGQFTMREFTIVGSPRPEELSYQIYGTTDYEWVLLLINGVIDPWYGWLKSDEMVRAYANKKYAAFGGADAIHHYYDPVTNDEYYDVAQPDTSKAIWYNKLDTDKVYPQFSGQLIPVTNVEFEISVNEGLRKIVIIPQVEIKSFVDTFERVHNGNG